ncbi:Gfo/Idh/MocA family oxidoreductase [Sphingomonas sp.]|uniref:Gfo/Idh/MocA family protein n=1 Tax=Sphingomonas sp. TaxID=28214 RepID=UPI002C10FCA1|nr:Gfo/Idh/MocA family oxidoreductase [Sphingomonas sp.]HWK35445.1 Gfo/Idh/MocA family oxidoreductase [Sphingomonas sp.]
MSTGSDQRIGIGVIGLGMAGGVMVPVIAAHPRLRLVAAADLNPVLRERFARDHGVPAFDDVAALVARDDVEAVYVATPHALHARHVLLALAHGKHVVVEKPMGLTLAECDAMIAAADAAKATMIVGHTHGFDPAIARIRDLVEEGAVGEPVLVNLFNYTNFLYRPRRPEELDPAQGGGVLWNQLPHQIDVARTVIGRPIRSVRAMTAALDPARRVDGLVSVFAEFDGGATAMLVYSGYDRFDSDEFSEWIGASGQAKQPAHGATARALPNDATDEVDARQTRWGYGGDSMRPVPAAGLPHFGQLIVSCVNADIRQSPRGLIVYDRDGMREVPVAATAARPGHAAVFDELWAALRGGAPAVHDGRFGRATIEACLAIAESARLGAEVGLNVAMGVEVTG